MLHAVVVREPEDELPRRLVAIHEQDILEIEIASAALTVVVFIAEPLSVVLVIFVCVGSLRSSESFSRSFLWSS